MQLRELHCNVNKTIFQCSKTGRCHASSETTCSPVADHDGAVTEQDDCHGITCAMPIDNLEDLQRTITADVFEKVRNCVNFREKLNSTIAMGGRQVESYRF
jgi:hypothetical protein